MLFAIFEMLIWAFNFSSFSKNEKIVQVLYIYLFEESLIKALEVFFTGFHMHSFSCEANTLADYIQNIPKNLPATHIFIFNKNFIFA